MLKTDCDNRVFASPRLSVHFDVDSSRGILRHRDSNRTRSPLVNVERGRCRADPKFHVSEFLDDELLGCKGG